MDSKSTQPPLPKLDQKFINELVHNSGIFDQLATIAKTAALHDSLSEFEHHVKLYRYFIEARNAHDNLIKTLTNLHANR